MQALQDHQGAVSDLGDANAHEKLHRLDSTDHPARGGSLQWSVDLVIHAEPLITRTYPLSKIDEAYELFENKRDGVIKVAVEC